MIIERKSASGIIYLLSSLADNAQAASELVEHFDKFRAVSVCGFAGVVNLMSKRDGTPYYMLFGRLSTEYKKLQEGINAK